MRDDDFSACLGIERPLHNQRVLLNRPSGKRTKSNPEPTRGSRHCLYSPAYEPRKSPHSSFSSYAPTLPATWLTRTNLHIYILSSPPTMKHQVLTASTYIWNHVQEHEHIISPTRLLPFLLVSNFHITHPCLYIHVFISHFTSSHYIFTLTQSLLHNHTYTHTLVNNTNNHTLGQIGRAHV